MKLKHLQINEAQEALKSLEAQKPSDYKIGYSIAKNIDLLDQEIRGIERRKKSLIKKHGTEQKNGSIMVEPGRAAIAFEEEWDYWLDQESDEINLRRFTLEQLKSAGLELSIGDLKYLWFMIEEEAPAE